MRKKWWHGNLPPVWLVMFSIAFLCRIWDMVGKRMTNDVFIAWWCVKQYFIIFQKYYIKYSSGHLLVTVKMHDQRCQGMHRLFAKKTEDMNEDNNIVIITPASRVRWILCRRECRRGCGSPARSSAWWRPAAGRSRCSRPRWTRRGWRWPPCSTWWRSQTPSRCPSSGSGDIITGIYGDCLIPRYTVPLLHRV